MLEGTPGLTFRRLNDPSGDTGAFLIFTLEDAARAKRAVRRLRAAGLDSATRLADYGLHIYFNIPQLTGKVPLSPAGNPWSLPENGQSVYDYRKGTCPFSDDLFDRAILLPIPSRLSQTQEAEAAKLIREAVA